MQVVLNDLNPKNILRNTPLKDINAKYRWKQASESAQWRTVEVGAPKLANKTFNDLGPAWTDSDWWIADVM